MAELTVLILAGGASRRMGTDKGWLEIDGMPLVELVARRLLPLASEVLISAGENTAYEAVAARLPVPARAVYDRYPGSGPLAGLHAGLSESRSDLALAVATDMPFVQLPLVERMIERAGGCDAVVALTPSPDDAQLRPEPLLALYRRSCLPSIQQALQTGSRRTISFYPDVAVCYLSPDDLKAADPQMVSFINVNTPEEWAEAEARLSGS